MYECRLSYTSPLSVTSPPTTSKTLLHHLGIDSNSGSVEWTRPRHGFGPDVQASEVVGLISPLQGRNDTSLDEPDPTGVPRDKRGRGSHASGTPHNSEFTPEFMGLVGSRGRG